jgi:hypothetical protein
MGTLMNDMEEERLPTLYLDQAQLKKLGDVGDVGDTREIHCTVRVASVSDSQDGTSATLEVVEMAFMEDGEKDGAASRMYPTMKG